MGYSVVETPKRNSKATEISVVPDGWVDNVLSIVFWPKHNMATLKNQENSKHEQNWIPRVIKKIWHCDLERFNAEEMVNHYINIGVSNASDADSDLENNNSKNTTPHQMLPRPEQYSLKRVHDNLDSSFSTTPNKRITKNGVTDGVDDHPKPDSRPEHFLTNDIIDSNEIVTDGKYCGFLTIQLEDGSISVTSPDPQQEPIQCSILKNERLPSPSPLTNNENSFALNEGNVIITENEFVAIHRKMENMEIEMAEMKAKIDEQAEMLGKIFANTNNTERFIKEYLEEKSANCEDRTGNETVEEVHDFEDLEAMKRIETLEEMQEFERLLETSDYTSRFIRFLKSKYSLTAYHQGQTIFTLIIRLVINPEFFLPYSWRGIHRKDSKNISFSLEHVTFVNFMKRVVRIYDRTQAESDVDEMFLKLLRFKKQFIEREKQVQTKTNKVPAPRIRVPKVNVILTENSNPADGS